MQQKWVIIAFFLMGCSAADMNQSGNPATQDAIKELFGPSVSAIIVENNTLKVTGLRLDRVYRAQLKSSSKIHELLIQRQSATQLILLITSAVEFVMGAVHDLILTTAEAASTISITVSFEDGSLSLIKLARETANHRDVLAYNEDTSQWEPQAPATLSLEDNAVISSKIADRAVTAAKLNQMDATNNQVLTWNSTLKRWEPKAIPASPVSGIIVFQASIASYSVTTGTMHFMNSAASSEGTSVTAFAIAPVSGTLKNLRVRSGPTGESATCELWVLKNGLPTLGGINIPSTADTSVTDLVNTVSVTAGDRISFEIIATGICNEAFAAIVELHYTL